MGGARGQQVLGNAGLVVRADNKRGGDPRGRGEGGELWPEGQRPPVGDQRHDDDGDRRAAGAGHADQRQALQDIAELARFGGAGPVIELYLPKSWIADRARCGQAAVPDDVEFATKTDLARTILGLALDAEVPAAW